MKSSVDEIRRRFDADVERFSTRRPLAYQHDLLTRAAYRNPEVLHKHLCFAAFGAVRP